MDRAPQHRPSRMRIVRASAGALVAAIACVLACAATAHADVLTLTTSGCSSGNPGVTLAAGSGGGEYRTGGTCDVTFGSDTQLAELRACTSSTAPARP